MINFLLQLELESKMKQLFTEFEIEKERNNDLRKNGQIND